MRNPIRVLIVDKNAETRKNLPDILRLAEDIEVAGTAGTGREAMQLAQELTPDVILIDLLLPDFDGITTTETIKGKMPWMQMVVLSVQGDPGTMRRALLADVRHYLVKPPKGTELIAAIRRAGNIAHADRAKATTARLLGPHEGSVFISYASEDSAIIDKLQHDLESCGIRTWRDRSDFYPGLRWKSAMRRAIKGGAIFLACFSQANGKQPRTDQNEELILAIDTLRSMPNDRTWFIPIKLNRCELPEWGIGGGETLGNLRSLELFPNWEKNMISLVSAIKEAATRHD